jgi:GNAT superfamily N-acetyltransferase
MLLLEKLQLRSVTPADIPTLAALARRIWHAHYPSIISRAQIDYMLADRYSAEAIAARLLLPNGLYQLAFWQGEPAGFLAATREADHCFIHQCYVDTEMHGHGIGTALMQQAFDFADGQPLRLQVNRLNIKAINFYFRHGFTIERINELEIGDGFAMCDFIMGTKI